MKFKTIILCLLAVFLLAGCGKTDVPPAEEQVQETVSEELRKPEKPEGKLYEYRLPFDMRWIIGQSSYAQMLQDIDEQDYKPLPPINDYYYDIEIVEGRSAVIRVTEQQRQAIIDNNLKLLKECQERYKNTADVEEAIGPDGKRTGGMEREFYLEWADDYSALTCSIIVEDFTPDFAMDDDARAMHLTMAENIIHLNRILTTDDIYAPIHVTYLNANSGHVLCDGLMPYEGLVFNGNDYLLSFTQDVAKSGDREGYEKIRMAVKQADTDKIIFTPIDHRELYPNDESLAMSLEDWEQNISLPLKDLREGDKFVLILNGEYDEDDTGEEIHYIDPVSITPARYYDEIHP